MQTFLDIVLTQCDTLAAMQQDDQSKQATNKTAPHWATVFADEDRLIRTNNFNFLPVGSGAPGFKSRLLQHAIHNNQKRKPTSFSLNPMHDFKEHGSIAARGMRDVRRTNTPRASSTSSGEANTQLQQQDHHSVGSTRTKWKTQIAFRAVSSSRAEPATSSGSKVEHPLRMHSDGEFPAIRHKTPHTHHQYIDRVLQAQDGAAALDSCVAAGNTYTEESMPVCHKPGRYLTGVMPAPAYISSGE